MSKLLWQPSEERKASTNIAKFMTFVNERHDSDITTYDALHAYSVSEQEKFWSDIWDFCGVKAEIRGERVIENGDKMPGARYFPDSRLNYAENMLQRRDDKVTLIFRGEDKVRREVTARELHDDVSRIVQCSVGII